MHLIIHTSKEKHCIDIQQSKCQHICVIILIMCLFIHHLVKNHFVNVFSDLFLPFMFSSDKRYLPLGKDLITALVRNDLHAIKEEAECEMKNVV